MVVEKLTKQERLVTPKRSFSERVRDVVRKIPEGKTKTYKEVAVLVGSPRASRAVGSVMKANYDPSVPCHRVVRSDGSVGDYNRGGQAKKRALLKQEGAF